MGPQQGLTLEVVAQGLVDVGAACTAGWDNGGEARRRFFLVIGVRSVGCNVDLAAKLAGVGIRYFVDQTAIAYLCRQLSVRRATLGWVRQWPSLIGFKAGWSSAGAGSSLLLSATVKQSVTSSSPAAAGTGVAILVRVSSRRINLMIVGHIASVDQFIELKIVLDNLLPR